MSALAVTLRVGAYDRLMPKLVELAAHAGGSSVDALTGSARHSHLVDLRCAITLVGGDVLGESAPVIGQALGGRDHSTVSNLRRRGRALCAGDERFANFCDGLADACRQLMMVKRAARADTIAIRERRPLSVSARESQIMDMWDAGMTPKAIARQLNLRAGETAVNQVISRLAGNGGYERKARKQAERGSQRLAAAIAQYQGAPA